jgi:lipopolysaccharide export system protein LptA
MILKARMTATLLAGLIAVPSYGYARSGDTEQPMHIEADSAEFNDNTGVSVYRGKVRVNQGSMVLTGDVVTVVAPKQRIQKVTSEGNLSTFHFVNDDNREIDAEAEYMEYNIKDQKIILRRKARLTEGQNTFSSVRIVYDTQTRVVDAGDPKKNSRVKMTIMPQSLKSKPKQ